MLLICYKKCSTCREVEKILKEKAISYDYRHIDKENPSREEIKQWHEKSGLEVKKLFNTSGLIYREKKLKDRLANLSLEEKYDLLSSDGLLVKRPILIGDNKILVGPQVKKYLENNND